MNEIDGAEYLRELSDKVLNFKVDDKIMAKNPWLAKNMPDLKTNHTENCKCGYCDEKDVAFEDEMTALINGKTNFKQDLLELKLPIYGSDINSHEQEAYMLKQMTHEEEIKVMAKIAAEDKNLPTLKQHEWVEPDNSLKKWDEFLKSCVTTYNMTVGQPLDKSLRMKPLSGLLIFYVDVGTIPRERAEIVVAEMRDKLMGVTTRLPDNWVDVWIPVREGGTRIERCQLNG